MKIYISADIEGTCGIVHWDETQLENNLSTYNKDQMTKEVNAACLGINDLKKSDILIKDDHALSHTLNTQFDYIKINDDIASEFTINAYTSAYYNVPVPFLSGDEMLQYQFIQLLL